jgi:hypothetical protein
MLLNGKMAKTDCDRQEPYNDTYCRTATKDVQYEADE